MSNTKLIGSAGNIKQLLEYTTRFFCGSTITFERIDAKTYSVHNANGLMDWVRVKVVKGRYRLERV
jgi:hypothetical protein